MCVWAEFEESEMHLIGFNPLMTGFPTVIPSHVPEILCLLLEGHFSSMNKARAILSKQCVYKCN